MEWLSQCRFPVYGVGHAIFLNHPFMHSARPTSDRVIAGNTIPEP